MPARLAANNQRSIGMDIPPDLISVSYRYPNKLNLRPDQDLHKKLVDMVMQRAFRAHDALSDRHEIWEKILKNLTVYIEKDSYEKQVKQKDSRKPVSLVIPTSYALRETLMTNLTGNFLSSPPYFRYQGRGPEDTVGAILLEMAIGNQSIKQNHALSLMTQWSDAITYGFGVIVPEWRVDRGRRSVMVSEISDMDPDGIFDRRMNEDSILFEGHKLCNVNPYRYLPDPTVPIHDPNAGEYVGFIRRTNMISLVRGEDNDEYFNVKYLKHYIGREGAGISYLYDDTESAERHGPKPKPYDQGESRPIDVISMYIDLIPEEWGIGKKDIPEKWRFDVAADGILINAGPLNLNHNKFPVSVCAPDSDGYAGAPLSKMEVVNGLQESLSWLWNSHITNIRKSLNNMLIIDPKVINAKSLANPEAGLLGFTRQSVWGKARIADYIHQLKVEDVTRGNVADMAVVQGMIERAVTSDQMMGVLPSRGERISANEAQGARLAGLSRLEYMAMTIAFQSLHGLADMLASQTQQFISEDVYQKAIGRWGEALIDEFGIQNIDPNVLIHPADIMVEYDIEPADPVSGNGEFVSESVQLFQIIASNPMLSQKFDMVRILKSIARKMGFKNLKDFEAVNVNTQIMNQQQIAGLGQNISKIGDLDAA